MILSQEEFDAKLAAARKVNRIIREQYAKEGRISPVKCSPYCAVVYIRSLIESAMDSDDWDQVMQAVAIATDLLAYWRANDLRYDRCTDPQCGMQAEMKG